MYPPRPYFTALGQATAPPPGGGMAPGAGVAPGGGGGGGGRPGPRPGPRPRPLPRPFRPVYYYPQYYPYYVQTQCQNVTLQIPSNMYQGPAQTFIGVDASGRAVNVTVIPQATAFAGLPQMQPQQPQPQMPPQRPQAYMPPPAVGQWDYDAAEEFSYPEEFSDGYSY